MKLVNKESVSMLGHVNAAPMIAGRIGPAFAHNADYPTHANWDRYTQWRKTKCRARDYTLAADRMDDMNQATHEFVGEVAEVGEVVNDAGVDLITVPEQAAKLIDEVGDVFFCGAWLLDAWGGQFLTAPYHAAPADMVDVRHREALTECRAAVLGRFDDMKRAGDPGPVPSFEVEATLTLMAFRAGCNAGLLANAFKKVLYQNRRQDLTVQASRIEMVFVMCAHLLSLAGATVEDALKANIAKLDARYPDGYVPSVVGGGIRTGKGA